MTVREGVALHVEEAGPADGPVVLLVHGIPEDRSVWAGVVPVLVASGFRVVTTDLRGAGRSDKPARVRDYRDRELVADLAAVAAQVGRGGAVDVVGHDRGGWLTWLLASHRPELVRRAVVIAAPHPAGLRAAMRTAGHWRTSWFYSAFQVPVLPELLLGARDGRLARVLLDSRRRGDPPSAADRDRMVAALRDPAVRRATAHYYRGSAWSLLLRDPVGARRRPPRVTAPVLVIEGDRDRWTTSVPPPGPDLAACVTTRVLAGAGHWMLGERPGEVAAAVLDHLGPPPRPGLASW